MEDREDNITTFWFVWNECGMAPRCKHGSEQSARNEAERLARANPGQQFNVLELIGACQVEKPPVLWSQAVEIPF